MIKSKADKPFDDIRPLRDDEAVATIKDLLNNYYFRRAVEPFIKPIKWGDLESNMSSCKTVSEFQLKVIYPVFANLIKKTSLGVKGLNWENITGKGDSYVFVSNHRDIILDASFLNMGMMDKGLSTTEVAIGDNLLIYPWISNLMRLNKSFIVKRSASLRQKLEEAKHLSEYIHHVVVDNKESVWIAQREGRAKNSDDKTQASVLKMLSLSGNASPLMALKNLNITPLSFSYELDPCDYLKAKELQQKRDNPEYKKTLMNDLESMITGLVGFKGHVYFKFGECINSQFEKMDPALNNSDFIQKTAEIIDAEIYRNYVFFPFNYVAYDLMTGTATFKRNYSLKDERRFEKYLERQIAKIDMPRRDAGFLRNCIINIYGNPVKNYLSVLPSEPKKDKKSRIRRLFSGQ
ncbi:MAG: 1-acyl-sn-glycerol-3-phosphate acyltransferase [Dysgonamonadaceae bacterium]|jgi:hypothetical protein|nr:1-acyl-sn-glycerol-3-phosphate acyltransferase [Dysgonamonadaceae bacterium]